MSRQEYAPSDTDQLSEKREIISIEPSALETAFENVIQTFGSTLLPPYLNRYEQAVRISTPTEVHGNIVAFEYRRLNPLNENSEGVSKMILALNPSLHKTIGEFKRAQNKAPSMTDLLDEVHHEDTLIEAVEDRIIARDGVWDPTKAISDSTYLTEGNLLLRWPERFEVSIFQSKEHASFPLQPAELGRKGKLHGIRPDVWLFLTTSLQYHPNWDAGGSEIIIRHPQREYDTLIAYNRAFVEHHQEYPDSHGIDIDDIAWFGDSRPWTEPVFPTQYPPERIMGQVEVFIRELTK